MPNTILYYSDSRSFGGAEQYLLIVFQKLDRNLWSPALVYHPHSAISSFIDNARELEVHTCPAPEVCDYADVKNIYQLRKVLKSLQPSVFHANLNWPLSCSYGIFAAVLAGIKTRVATQHLYADLKSRRNYLQQRFISKFVNRYIAVSHDTAKHMKESISPHINVDVIHNGIIIDNYEAPDSDEIRNDVFYFLKGKKLPIILTVARLDKQKGHKYLLEAASMIQNAAFVLAGDGPERSNLESYAKELNIDDRVFFLGHRDDISELINGCDMFVLPSLYEGLPLTIIEAMAAEKPVIASDLPGIEEEVIDNETGLLVPKENSQALAQAIKSLISNPEYARKLGSAGGVRAREEFSAEKMTRSITDLYKELLNIEG